MNNTITLTHELLLALLRTPAFSRYDINPTASCCSSRHRTESFRRHLALNPSLYRDIATALGKTVLVQEHTAFGYTLNYYAPAKSEPEQAQLALGAIDTVEDMGNDSERVESAINSVSVDSAVFSGYNYTQTLLDLGLSQ